MKQILTFKAVAIKHGQLSIWARCVAVMVILLTSISQTKAYGDIVGIAVDNGMCYNIYSDGTATLFGNLEEYGGNPNFSGPYVIPQQVEYNGKFYEVNCINPVFCNIPGLTAIVIPPSVIRVDTSFRLCPNLKTIIFADGDTLCDLMFGNTYVSEGSNVEYLYVGRPLARYEGKFKDLVGTTIKTIHIGNVNRSLVVGESVMDFRGCTSLEEIVIDRYIPDGYPFSDSYFADLKNLKSVIFTENSRLKSVPNFTGCTSLKYLNVPSTVTYCPAGALQSSPKGSKMICYATTPPSLSDVIFNYQNYSYYGSIYVPSEAKDLYKNNSLAVWERQHIYSIPESQDVVFATEEINLITGETTSIYPRKPINDILGGIWRSSDNSVAIVNNGKISAIGSGECYITLQSGDVLSNKVKVTVSDFIPIERINLNANSLELRPTEQYSLTTQILPENATKQTLKWTTSNSCVSISQNGVITANSPGSAIIRATATDGTGVYAECKVKVIQPVTSISVTPMNAVLYEGEQIQLTVTVLPEFADNNILQWTSSNDAIATVSDTGLVTALTEGSAQIIVSSTDGSNLSATCSVEVCEPDVLVTSITITPSVITGAVGETYQLMANILPDNATEKSVTWISDNPVVASVGLSGLVSLISNGKAIIKATATDGSEISATCTVIVDDSTGIANIEKTSDEYFVYNLQGIMIMKTEDYGRIKRLPAGIYIVNGKKLIVK